MYTRLSSFLFVSTLTVTSSKVFTLEKEFFVAKELFLYYTSSGNNLSLPILCWEIPNMDWVPNPIGKWVVPVIRSSKRPYLVNPQGPRGSIR